MTQAHPPDLGDSIAITSDVAVALADACHLDAAKNSARVEIMLVLTRLVLAEHPRRAARDSGPQTGHKLASLARAVEHLRAFAEEAEDWNQGSPPSRTHDAGDPDGLVDAWRLVELQFTVPVPRHYQIDLGSGVLDVGQAIETLNTAIRVIPNGLLARVSNALVGAVEAAHGELCRRVAEHPTAAVRHKPRKDGLRQTMCELCHVFDGVHLVAHEDDRKAQKIEFVQRAVAVVGETLADGTIANRLRGPEHDEYFTRNMEESLRSQGVTDDAIKVQLAHRYRSALETPPAFAFDESQLLALIREPVVAAPLEARAAWCQAFIDSGFSARVGASVAALIGRPRVG